MASVLVDQNYDSIELKQAKEMRARHISQFKATPATVQKEKINGSTNFNDEELYFLNRIAFRLFKDRGARASFKDFVNDITTLQEGSFEGRLTLWLHLVCEMEERVQLSKKTAKTTLATLTNYSQRLNLQNSMVSI